MFEISRSVSGCAGTCYAFYQATRSSKAGDSMTTNRMFRYRIYGQAFTLIAIMGGAYYYKTDRMLRQEIYFAKEEKKAKEKKNAWIKELEIRDQEDRDLRVKIQRLKGSDKDAVEGESSGDEEVGRSVLDAVKKVEEATKAGLDAAKAAEELRKRR